MLEPMRLATWNVNSLKARLERVAGLDGAPQPDVLCLQETKLTDEQAPRCTSGPSATTSSTMAPAGGTAWPSRHGSGSTTSPPASRLQTAGPMTAGASLLRPAGRCALATIYVPNGRVVDSEFYLEKLEWLARLSVWLNGSDPSTELAICGDFNVAPADEDVWDPASGPRRAPTSAAAERAAVAKLRQLGMVELVRQFHPEPGFFSWYRAGTSTRLRHALDHI